MQNSKQKEDIPTLNRLRNIGFEITPDPLLICGWNQNIIDANAAACRFWGYNIHEFKRLHLTDLFTFENVSVDHYFTSDLNINTAITGCILKDQTIRKSVLKWRSFSVDGIRYLFIALLRLPDKMEFERILRERDLMFRKITAAAKDAILIMDDHGRITFWNKAATDIFGYTEKECLGKNLHDLLTTKETYNAFQKKFERFSATGKGLLVGKLIETEAVRKSGERFPIELSMASVQIEGRWHAIGIVRDITLRKKAESELIASRKKLELNKLRLEKALAQSKRSALEAAMANAAKSQFLANISHEIRTPLHGIIGVAGLLKSMDLTEEQREFISALESSTKTLMTLVDDILDFSKISAGKTTLERVSFDPYQLIEETVNLLSYKAKMKNLALRYDIDPDLPVPLIGDAGKIRQVLINLVGNAIKFTESGEVMLTVRKQQKKQAPLIIDFYIKDTGMGIPPDKQDIIFEAFSQVDSSSTRKFGGIGLGLAISKKLIELMEGTIDVQSSGSGSVFHFRLPFKGMK